MPSRNSTAIAFIGFGEAARAFTASLKPQGIGPVAAYDILIGLPGDRHDRLVEAAGALEVALTETPDAAIAGAALIFSAVTAAESLEAVRPLVGQLKPGQVVIDINSVSAQRKRDTAAMIRAAGAGYVDMAVMAPVHPKGHRTSTLLAGDLAAVEMLLRTLDFQFEVVGTQPGMATAVKMVRSLFVKGLEAITVQALTAAHASGCYDRVAASLAASFPGLGWPEFGAYEFERIATHGIRRAAEMREVAVSMAELGFAEGAALASAIAGLHQRVGDEGPAPGLDAGQHAARLAGRIGSSK